MNALTRSDKMFDDLFPEFFRRFARMPATIEGPADIRVEVKEDDKGYEVRAEVPGAKKEDIRVAIDGDAVSISTEEVKEEKEEKSEKEPMKIWGSQKDGKIVPAAEPVISAQCIRVPASDGHMAAAFVSFDRGGESPIDKQGFAELA